MKYLGKQNGEEKEIKKEAKPALPVTGPQRNNGPHAACPLSACSVGSRLLRSQPPHPSSLPNSPPSNTQTDASPLKSLSTQKTEHDRRMRSGSAAAISSKIGHLTQSGRRPAGASCGRTRAQSRHAEW
jgi:hypothetical protein